MTLTGQLHWTGRAPAVTTVLDRTAHALRMSYRCVAASRHCRVLASRRCSRAAGAVLGQPGLSGHATGSRAVIAGEPGTGHDGEGLRLALGPRRCEREPPAGNVSGEISDRRSGRIAVPAEAV
ncbi:MAG TPA: hypothetical protein VMV92_31305 [Streptosporangiaceae bacterium]|nr:hypothetical protein [Streptosporangiaceae bacterium]